MKYIKIYCIKNYSHYNFTFIKDRIYNATIDNNFYNDMDIDNKPINRINITSDNKSIFEFDDTSPFSINTYPNHFINIQELRKKKLDKINKTI